MLQIFHLLRFNAVRLVKKPAPYFLLVFYLLSILTYSYILPKYTDYSPIQIFTLSIFMTFLWLSNSIFVAYFTVEVFRTPIEDGSELVILAKAISRYRIF